MGKLLNFLGKLAESSIEITDDAPPIINNYYITINNKIIKLSHEDFKNHIALKMLGVKK